MASVSCRTVCIMILWLSCATMVRADEIKDVLDRAKKQYQESVDKAGTFLLSAFDEQVKALATTGNVDAVKVIIDEKEAFKASKTRPATSFMKEGLARYDQAVKGANAAVITAHEKAIADYTKALKVDDAQQVKLQLAQLKLSMEGKSSTESEDGPTGSDAIMSKLLKAKSAHGAALGQSKTTVRELIEKRKQTAADQGDLAGFKLMEKAGADFESNGSLSSDVKDSALKAAVLQHDNSIKAGKTKLVQAYQEAIRDYTKARKIAEAQKVQTELDEFQGKSSSASNSAEEKKPVSQFAPKEDHIIGEDVHTGRATNHPSYTKGNIYTIKIDPKDPLIKLADTMIYFQAFQPSDLPKTQGIISISADYGKTWLPVFRWTGEIMKTAKRRDNWHYLQLAPYVKKVGKSETDEIQIKFEVEGIVEEINVNRVAWVRK